MTETSTKSRKSGLTSTRYDWLDRRSTTQYVAVKMIEISYVDTLLGIAAKVEIV